MSKHIGPSYVLKLTPCAYGYLRAWPRLQLMKYHGNYCGPNWSAGKQQPSTIDDNVHPTDEFDHTCMVHDAAYYNQDNLAEADMEFFSANFLKGAKRTLAAVAVGAQGQARLWSAPTNMTKNQPNLRSVPATPHPKNKPAIQLSQVPSAYGFTVRMTQPKIVRSGNKASIIGADFASTVATSNTNSYAPAASILLNPAYFQNSMLGSLSRAYEKFRFTRATVQYIPSVPTSTQGQLVMCSTRTVKEPFLDGSSTTFLSRALSQGNAVACPLWRETTLDVSCNNEWSVVDALIDADLDDAIQEEVQIYAFCDTTQNAGILILHYEIEFKDPLYVYHSTLIPVPYGNGTFITFSDNTNVNATTDAIALANSSIAFGTIAGYGSVYRLVFRPSASTLPTGPASWSAVAKVQNTVATTTTTLTPLTTNITLAPGTTLYGVYGSGGVILYASYDDAVAGTTNGMLAYQTATTALGVWAFIMSIVRIDPANRVTIQ